MNSSLATKKRFIYISTVLGVVSFYILRTFLQDFGAGILLPCLLLVGVVWSLFGIGYSDTLSRMLKSRYSRGQKKNGNIIWRNALWMQLLFAAIGSGMLFLFGNLLFTKWLSIPEGANLISIFAGWFFLRMITEAFDGYVSGRNADVPGCIASMLRQVLFCVFSLVFCKKLSVYGMNVSKLLGKSTFESVYAGYGVALGALAAEVVVLIFYLVIFMLVLRSELENGGDGYRSSENSGSVFVNLWRGRGFVPICGILLFAGFLLILILCARQKSEINAQEIGYLFYGQVAPALLYSSFTAVFFMPVLAKFVRHIRNKEHRYAKTDHSTGFHVVSILGIFGCGYTIALKAPLQTLLFPMEESAPDMLIGTAFVILLSCVATYFLLLLFSQGVSDIPAIIILGAVGIGTFFSFLFAKKEISFCQSCIYGEVIALTIMVIGFAVVIFMRLHQDFRLLRGIGIPLICGTISCLVNVLLTKLFTPHLGSLFTVIFCFAEMAVLYVFLLLLFRNLSEHDTKYLPLGVLINHLGVLLKVL